jgi:hypothetical protein
MQWAGPGALGLFVDGALVSAGCAFCYGADLAWLGCIATRPEHQRRGHGTRLTQALVEHAQRQGIKRVMLDAGSQGQKMYARLGFREVSSLERWRGKPPSIAETNVAKFVAPDFAQIVRLDARNFCVERPQVIRGILETSPNTSWVMRQQGEGVTGYVVLKPWIPGGSAHLGPWQAQGAADAEALLRTALGAWVGRDVYMDIPAENSDARQISARLGLWQDGAAARMIFGDAEPPPDQWRGQYGIAMRATG